MPPLVKAAGVYFSVVFAGAFLFGALRVAIITPLTGPLIAVAIELPLILCLSWMVAGWVAARWPLGRQASVVMGLLAFALLMLAELALATLLFGQNPDRFLGNMTTAPGALGLAGQIGFGLIPALRRQTMG
jgi:hypothetical protein